MKEVVEKEFLGFCGLEDKVVAAVVVGEYLEGEQKIPDFLSKVLNELDKQSLISKRKRLPQN